jgi:hypothetical protein
MAVDGLSSWKSRLLAMPNVGDQTSGAWNLANFCGDMMDKLNVQGGTVGVFTFDRPLFVSTLLAVMSPDGGTAWAGKLASAWATASGSNTVTPATVTNGAWAGGSTKDILTSPSGNSTIVNLSAAKSALESSLIAVGTPFVNKDIQTGAQADSSNEAFAKSFRDATLMFQFKCIGLNPAMIPTPVTLGVE